MSNVICLARYLKKCAIKKILLLKYLYSESEIEIQTFNKNFMVILQKKKKRTHHNPSLHSEFQFYPIKTGTFDAFREDLVFSID